MHAHPLKMTNHPCKSLPQFTDYKARSITCCFAKVRMHVYCIDLLILLLVAQSAFIACLVQHISPTPQCLVESCVTLSQFAANTSIQQETDMTLILLPGNHSLTMSISITNLNEFRMQTIEGFYAEIMCTESANVYLHHIHQVYISGVKFLGCQGSLFEFINQISMENLAFTSQYSSGAALELDKIVSAHIIGSHFISNTAGTYRSNIELLKYLKSEDSSYYYIDTQAKIGGALITTRSNVYITECLFEANSAQVGGAIYAEHDSNVTILYSNFTQNRARRNDIPNPGGVIIVNSGCTVNIFNSIFWNNTHSGVIVLLSAKAFVRETTFDENSCSGSGGVFAMYESTLVVENSIFYKNTAQIFGGAIHAKSFSSINISEAVFDRNEAVFGGVINVKTQSRVRLRNSAFTSNKGIQFGGVMLMRVGSTLMIENSTLVSNTAIYGGVLYEIYSNITIKDSSFYNNTSSDHGGVMAGNLAGGSNVTLSNNAFLSNRAGTHGGVAVVFNSHLTVLNNTFGLNSAVLSGGVMYGCSGSRVSIKNSIVTHNSAYWGVIHGCSGSIIRIRNSTVAQNSAHIGIFYIDQSIITINMSTFESNSATLVGGFIFVNQSDLEVFNSNFADNRAIQEHGEGGVFYVYNASVLLHNCTFSHNLAVFAGVMRAVENCTIIVDSSAFSHNMATSNGGVAMIWNSVIMMDNNIFTNNTAIYGGGAMTFDYARMTSIVQNCVFINNSAEIAGAIYIYKSNVTISQDFFLNNTATDTGGALSLASGSYMLMNNSIFLDNAARTHGGALMIRNLSTLTTHNNTYSGNLASASGGVANLIEKSLFLVNNDKFIGNRVDYGGGAISMNNSTSFLGYCTFSLNQAGRDGGALHVFNASHIHIRSSTFVSNSAPSLATLRESPNCKTCVSTGGVIWTVLLSTVVMDNCTFMNNLAEYGGSIANTVNSNITIHQCIFFNNTGLIDGAALYSSGFVAANITKSMFLSNRASENGGAISLYNRNKINIDSCTFGDNSASIAGGVLYCHRPEKLIINNSTFIGNSVGSVNPSGSVNLNQNTISSSEALLTECFNIPAHYGGGVIFVNSVIVNISNSTFTNNSANYGSVVRAICNSTVHLRNTTVNYNWAENKGGVINANKETKVVIEGSTLDNNLASEAGGVIAADQDVTITVESSSLRNNSADIGGTVQSVSSNVTINHATFHNNWAQIGTLNLFKSNCIITDSIFTQNSATQDGGTTIINQGKLSVYSSVFINNTATLGGVVYAVNASVSVSHSSCIDNRAVINGGAIYLRFQNNLTTQLTIFNHNSAGNDGGAIFSLLQNTIDVIYGQFSSNKAQNDGAVFFISYQTQLTLRTSDTDMITHNGSVCWGAECGLGMTIENNKAARGTVLFSNDFSLIYLKGEAPIEIKRNSANLGTLYLYESTLYSSTTVTFEDNIESIHTEKSTVVFKGNTSFINCTSSLKTDHLSQERKGGVVKSIQSDISFDGYTIFEGNTAENGAAILATESNVKINGETVIADNRVRVNGGGICLIRSNAYLRGKSIFTGNHAKFGGAVYLEQSTLNIVDESKVSNNTALNGGGLYSLTGTLNLKGYITVVDNTAEENGGGLLAIKSIIIGESITQFIDNKAQQGGACSLDGNTKFYQRLSNQSEPRFIFMANTADVGGALFIADDTNFELCANNPHSQNASAKCFFCTSTPYDNATSIQSIEFSDNSARISGANLFGGLLDRCTAKISTHSYRHREGLLSEGLAVFQAISRNSELDSIGSHPVRVCLCVDGFPNCSYHPPPIEIKSGQMFPLQLAALDQANHVVNATIHSLVDSHVGGLGDGQAIQKIHEACTDLMYSIYSPHQSEQLDIHTDGPCSDEGISRLTVEVKIVPCSCPIGFQVLSDDTNNCVCGCDSILAAYITECEHSTESVIRRGNFWLTYINASEASGYLVYPNCPLDYCHLPTALIKINLNQPSGSDAQCTSNKAGLLCGACQENLSLSLGSSHCIPCPRYWPVLMIVILIIAFLAGIGLVVVLLVLNLTVAVGTINALVFYANIVEAYKSTFFPSSTVSFASIIISWLNLELGFDVCLFEGMNKYTKTWLQLAFPMYVIFLVGAIIFTSQHSTRFSQLVGKKNPVATMATLILLSYAKLLQTVITALSFATLEYPDGSRKTVWLPDATVQYFYGKHSALFLVAIIILFIGILFTSLLLFWQWILRLPDARCLRLIRHHKLKYFIETYHAPYNPEYRYWTGLLLLVRVILYFVAAVNVSGDPRVTYLTLLFILGGLMTGKWILKSNLNKMWQNDLLEGTTYVNLLIFTAFSWYTFETGRNQSIAAHISVTVTLILLIVVIIYHVRTKTNIIASICNLKNYKLSRKMDHNGRSNKVASEVSESREHVRRTSTFSVVEVPRFDGSNTIPEESEGLANIEFHELEVEISGTCFVNPSHTEEVTETVETIVDEDTMLNRQADLILDELT